METTIFRKKPVEIEAIQWLGGNEQAIKAWATQCGAADKFRFDGSALFIETAEGRMYASVGDWIIRGVIGEFYPCKPDVFVATYDQLTDQERAEQAQRGYLAHHPVGQSAESLVGYVWPSDVEAMRAHRFDGKNMLTNIFAKRTGQAHVPLYSNPPDSAPLVEASTAMLDAAAEAFDKAAEQDGFDTDTLPRACREWLQAGINAALASHEGRA